MSNKKMIITTIITMFIIMIFYFVAGALVVMNNLSGTKAALIQGSCIWMSVLSVIIYFFVCRKKLTDLGFHKPNTRSLKKVLFCIPVILVGLSGLIGGMNISYGITYILSYMFLTIGVGFSEEIYFRGIICNIWQERGATKACLISSALFGVCHLLNIAGGASVVKTILQICFAFFYGLVFAYIFIITESIWPCVIIHFLHDFCSFIGNDLSESTNIILGAVQTVVIVIYFILLFYTYRREKTSSEV